MRWNIFAIGKPKLDFAPDETGAWKTEDAALMVCARIFGASERDLVRVWDKACSGADAGIESWRCQEWPKDIAAVKPPFTL